MAASSISVYAKELASNYELANAVIFESSERTSTFRVIYLPIN